ncbi:YdaU family protein [Devosia sp. A8/3-2]|nr:YdaU family protein [Devosia sp. A8/3-2]
MSKAKARRMDYYPDEYIAGVGGVLSAAQQGVYWMVCTLIMSEGGAVAQDDRRSGGLLRMRPAEVRKTIEDLIVAGKILRLNDGKLSQNRARSEVEKSLNRILIAVENGLKGGRPAEKDQQNQQKDEPNGSFSEETNHQPPTTNHQPKKREEGASASNFSSSGHSPNPAENPNLDWSDEERFWALADAAKAKGIAKSQMGQLANSLNGAF